MGEASAVAALDAPLALVEAIDRDGLVRQAWRVERWPVSIGRALDNTVVLSDPHVAAHHASVDLVRDDDSGAATIAVAAGETRNGVVVGREHLAAGATKRIADDGRDLELHIGRARAAAAPAGPCARSRAGDDAGRRRREALAADPRAAAWRCSRWSWPTPGSTPIPTGLARGLGAILLTTIAGGAIWCGLWALLSKTFTRQSHFGWHVRVFVIASLVTLVLAVLPPLLAFAFSWPWVTDFSFVAVYATVAAAIYFHLLAVEPGARSG